MNLRQVFSVCFSLLIVGNLVQGDWVQSGNDLYTTTDDVGIGTSNPVAPLHLNGTTSSFGVLFTNSANTVGEQAMRLAFDNDRMTFQRMSDSGAFEANYLTIMQDTGWIGHGTTNPSSFLHVINPVDGAANLIANFESRRTASNIYMRLRNLAYTGGNDIMLFADSTGRVGFHQSGGGNKFVINQDGFIGIHTTNPSYTLDVNGTARAKEIIVESNWADFVFEEDYALMPLEEVADFISEEKRLPGVKSAEEIRVEGASVSETQAMLLQKIEEMTLYIIQLENRIHDLENKN